MKLLIKEDLDWFLESEPDSTEEDHAVAADDLDHCVAQMRKLGVISKWNRVNNNYVLKIPVQKVTTDEQTINEFFCEWLIMFEYNISYAYLGGRGCDFALERWKA